tara:strand:- start:60 stop:1460 length:1401 start_codon:yes stop_codon:yes gene_type:complete
MISWFRNRLKNDPDSVFITYKEKSYTISDLSSNILSIQKVFSASDIKEKDRIMIFLPNGIDIVEIILACFESGIIAVPITTKFTNLELKKIIQIINPKAIITNWDLSSHVNDLNKIILEIEEFPSISRVCQVYNPNYNINKNDVAAIILTSGTTDTPKAVELTYKNFEVSCQNWNDFLNFEKKDQFLCCLPLHHIGGLAVIVRGLLFGFSINLAESFNADLLYKLIKRYPISIVSLVPTMLEKIIAKSDGISCLSNLRAVLLGGGPSSDSLLDICLEEKINIVKTYGMTETCSGIVGLWIQDNPDKKQFSGKPFRDVKIKIINDEVHIKGPMVMKGYLNENNFDEYHNSKDIGWLDENNNLFIEMRRKDLIISGGENINPKEIELLLIKKENIIDCAVIGIPNKKWGQKVVAYLCTENNQIIKNEELIEYLSIVLAKYKIPKNFIFVDFIPRNEIGKVVLKKIKLL